MMIFLFKLLSILSICLNFKVNGFLEKGKWVYYVTKNEQYIGVSKILYNQSNIRVSVQCNVPGMKIKYSWLLRLSPCGDEYSYLYDKSDLLTTYFNYPESKPLQFPYHDIDFQHSEDHDYQPCDHGFLTVMDESSNGHQEVKLKERLISSQTDRLKNNKLGTAKPIALPKQRTDTKAPVIGGDKGDVWSLGGGPTKLPNVKNEEPDQDITFTLKDRNIMPDEPQDFAGNFVNLPTKKVTSNLSRTRRRAKKYEEPVDPTLPSRLRPLTRTWKDGNYLFIFLIEIVNENGEDMDNFDPDKAQPLNLVTVKIDLADASGQYLSVHDWPLLPFYACMCALYTVLIFLWAFWSIYYFRELLRIQYWILAVIFLGFLEKSLFLGEYQMVNRTGTSIYGALVFAEIVSALKRALSRILIIIASIGYGIVKPRLGSTMRKVVCLGLTYFVFASIEGSLRVSKSKANPTSIIVFATIPVALLDAIICWWIFSGLVQTLRTLRLRHNVVKLSMYRHFTNILVFSVIASIAFMLWSLKEHKLITCVMKWRQLWLDDAFWHLLFSLILLAIIILWRPSANNQRYAFTPLLDGSDDENGINDYDDNDAEEREEFLITKARGTIKMRLKNMDEKKVPKEKPTSTEEDLKWIEDNIPPSIADTALPNILDSEEEENIKRFELGKMQ